MYYVPRMVLFLLWKYWKYWLPQNDGWWCRILVKKKNFIAPFYGWGLTASRLELLHGGSLLFTTKFPDITRTYFTRKDDRLSWPWSQPVVLNTGPLDWESRAFTTRPLPWECWWKIVSSHRKTVFEDIFLTV